MLDSSLVLLSVLLLVFLLLSGCGEMMSMWMNKPNGLVDVSQEKELISGNGEDAMSVDDHFSQVSDRMSKDGDQSSVLENGGDVIALTVNATTVFDKEIRSVSSVVSSFCCDCE